MLLLLESIVRMLIYRFSCVFLLSESIVRIIIHIFSSVFLLSESIVKDYNLTLFKCIAVA